MTVAIRTGAELKALEPSDIKAGAVIEYTKATDDEEGPNVVGPDDERACILTKTGEYDLETTPVGALIPAVAAAVTNAAIKEICISVAELHRMLNKGNHDCRFLFLPKRPTLQ